MKHCFLNIDLTMFVLIFFVCMFSLDKDTREVAGQLITAMNMINQVYLM